MTVSLSELARTGFSALSEAAANVEAVQRSLGTPVETLLEWCAAVPDPDAALLSLLALHDRVERPEPVHGQSSRSIESRSDAAREALSSTSVSSSCDSVRA